MARTSEKFRERKLIASGGVTLVRRNFPSGSVTWVASYVDPDTKKSTRAFAPSFYRSDAECVAWAESLARGIAGRKKTRSAREKPVLRGAPLAAKLAKLGFFEGYPETAIARAKKRLEKNARGFGRWPALALGVLDLLDTAAEGLEDDDEVEALLRFVARQSFGIFDPKSVRGSRRRCRSADALLDLVRASLRDRPVPLEVNVPDDVHDDELDGDDDRAARSVSFVIATRRAYDAAVRAGLLPPRDSLDDDDD